MWWLSIPSNRKRLIRAMLLSIVVVSFGSVVLTGLVYIGLRISQVILPGVYVGTQDLGFTTATSAAPLLDRTWNQNGKIYLVGDYWAAARHPAELGLFLNAADTARLAYEASYADGFLPSLIRMLGLAKGKKLVVPAITYDEGSALATLQAVQLEVSVVPQEARLDFLFSVDAPPVVSSIPGTPGRALDIETSLQTLRDSPVVTFMSGYLKVTFVPVNPAVAEIPPDIVAQAQTYLAQNLTLKAFDPVVNETYEWTISPESLAASLRVQIQGGQVTISVNPVPFQAELNQFSASLNPDRWLDLEGDLEGMEEALNQLAQIQQTADPPLFIVRHAPTTYPIQPGDTLLKIAWNQGIPLWRILQANPGLDPDQLNAGTVLTIPSKDDLIELPIVLGKRILIDLSDQHLYGFEGDNLVFDEVISTGIDRSPTQPGVFQVRSHVELAYASVWDLEMPNFVGIYEAWPGFENGLHGLPILSGGRTLWAGALGQPVSFGCIILNSRPAARLYEWAEEGVIVEIRE